MMRRAFFAEVVETIPFFFFVAEFGSTVSL